MRRWDNNKEGMEAKYGRMKEKKQKRKERKTKRE